MRTRGHKCYNIRCGSCIGKALCGEPADTALGCASRMVIVQTNADRIRSMTDEELAKMLGAFCYVAECRSPDDTPCPFYRDCPHYKIDGSWIDWLKQPVGGAE